MAGPSALAGLRPRLIGALAATSAITLVVAAVALLSPLEQRLRTERIDSLTADLKADGSAFEELPRAEVRAGGKRIGGLARALRRRTGADIAVVGGDGQTLVATDPGEARRAGDVARALRTGRVVTQTASDEGDPEVRVAVPVRSRVGPIVISAQKPLDAAQPAVGVVERALVEAALIALVIATLIGVFITTRLIRRLRLLRDTALRVAELGPSVEVRPDTARDEVGDLTRALATMQGRLHEQEQARRAFVSTASHELRTPLTSLQLVLGLLGEDLRSGTIDLDEARRQVTRAEAQTENLSQLAADLLDLSRIDAGIPMRHEGVELRDLCESVIAEFSGRLKETSQAVELVAPDACVVMADPSGTARVVRLLLDNALRFSPPDRPVTVSLTRVGEGGRVTVSDHGPGVPATEHEVVFERFRRGTQTGGEGGFGLGLAIGRELARRMGGGLQLDPVEHGASFTLELGLAEEGRDAD